MSWLMLESYGKDVKIFPQHEEILSNFKAQLMNCVRFTSLKTMCARKVIDFWPEYAKQGLTKLSSVLPKTLCSFVYQEFLDYLEPYTDQPSTIQSLIRGVKHEFDADLEEKLYLFAGDGLEEIDCRMLNLKSASLKNCLPPFYEHLAKGSPKLRSFKDGKHSASTYIIYFQDHMLVSEYYRLKTLSSLVVLQINICQIVQDADLKVIGLCLPLLQRLTLFAPKQEEIHRLKYLKNLKALQHLTFNVEDTTCHDSVKLVKKCLKLMPQVNTVATLEYIDFVIHKFPSYQDRPMELGLQHLVLGKKSAIPSNVTLPNVTKITVEKKLNVSLQQFKKLQDLCCVSLPWSQLEQTLAEVGHLLKKLKLTHCTYELTQAFQLCPNLEELHLIDVNFLGNFKVSQLKNCVHNLRIFKHEYYDKSEYESIIDSHGLLHLLLTCPDCEELKISGIRLTKEEMDLITEDLKYGTLATKKLQKVYISAEVEQNNYVGFAEFVCMLCVQHCNILKKVYFELSDLDEDEDKVPEMNLALKMQYYINNKHKFRLHF